MSLRGTELASYSCYAPQQPSLLLRSHVFAWAPPLVGYLSVAHYLVLNKLGSTAAKRAALKSGFCPSDLEGEGSWERG